MKYQQAKTLDQALALLRAAVGTPTILAGGTDLMVEYNRQPVEAGTEIIYIGDIPQLKSIRETPEALQIGALTTAAQLAVSRAVNRYARALAAAAANSAGPQVRNRATIGGNIATASPAGDLICALRALDADIVIHGTGGTRLQKIHEVITGVKQSALEKDAIIGEIVVPKTVKGCGSAFEKIGKRKAMTISTANAACAVQLDADGCIASVRVAIGAAAPTTVRATAVEEALTGRKPEEALIREAAKLAKEAISPITDGRATKWYRMEVVPALVARVIQDAVADARKEEIK